MSLGDSRVCAWLCSPPREVPGAMCDQKRPQQSPGTGPGLDVQPPDRGGSVCHIVQPPEQTETLVPRQGGRSLLPHLPLCPGGWHLAARRTLGIQART